MANYILNNFIRQITNGIQLFDKYQNINYNITTSDILETIIIFNNVVIRTKNSSDVIIDFSSPDEANLALLKLQVELDISLGVGGGGNGGFTNLNAQLPLNIIGNTISINQSTSNQNGYLSSDDWIKFNNITSNPATSTQNGYLSYTDWIRFNSITSPIEEYTSISSFPSTGQNNTLYIDLTTNLSWFWNRLSLTYSCISDIFTDDIKVKLKNGKTFGKYLSGDTIPAIGKTPKDIILESTVESIPPTVNLSVTPTLIEFNQTLPLTVTLNFEYIINTDNTNITMAILEFYNESYSFFYNNNVYTWDTIYSTTGVGNSYSVNFTYSIPISNQEYNNPNTVNYQLPPNMSYQFRYSVTDNINQTSITYSTINVKPYVLPVLNISVTASHLSLPIETIYKREVGNFNTIISGSFIQKTPYINSISYKYNLLYYNYLVSPYYINNLITYPISSSKFITYSDSSIINGGLAVSWAKTNYQVLQTNQEALSLSSAYQILYTDSFTTSNIISQSINYYTVIFYGATTSYSTASNVIRSMNCLFTDYTNNPFILNTGTISTIFQIAVPFGNTITDITDLDATNAKLLEQEHGYYPYSVNILDGGGNSKVYNIYTMISGIPYPTNHKHQITYS